MTTDERLRIGIKKAAAELFAGVKGDAEQTVLQDFVSLFRVAPENAEIGKSRGIFYKRPRLKRRGLSTIWVTLKLSNPLFLSVAEGPGFEPGLTGPEPVVLPLDDPPFHKAVLIHK